MSFLTDATAKKTDGAGSNRNDLLLTKLEEVSHSAREVALFRMECLSDDINQEADNGGGTSTSNGRISSSNSFDSSAVVEGLAQELVRLLMEALQEEEDDTVEAGGALLLRRVLPILEDITKTDPTLAEEVARSLCCPMAGYFERLQQVISSASESSEVDSASFSFEEKLNLEVLARDITTRFSDLLLLPRGAGGQDDVDNGKTTKTMNENDAPGDTSSGGGSFSRSELQSRLPLLFSIPQQQEQEQPHINASSISSSRNEHQLLPVEDMKIMVHQSSSQADAKHHDVGLVMWPSAVMLARHIVQNPHLVLDSVNNNNNNNNNNDDDVDNGVGTGGGGGRGTILELGSGCGLVGLTAAKLVQQNNSSDNKKDDPTFSPNLFLTDYNPQVLSNLKRNLHLNDLDDGCTSVIGLDFFDQQPPSSSSSSSSLEKDESPTSSSSSSLKKPSVGCDDDDDDDGLDSSNWWIDMEGVKHPQADLILAADIICYSNDAELVANTIRSALKPKGGKAIVLGPDEDQRFGIQYFAQECYNCGLQVEVTNLNCSSMASTNSADHHHQQQQQNQLHLDHDLEQTSGFHPGYNLTMFTIECA